MIRNMTYNRKKICVFGGVAIALGFALIGRLIYLMLFQHEYYLQKAIDLQQRERQIKAARGEILDRNGVVLATNEAVCTISVIHNQIKEPEMVITILCQELGLSEEYVRKRVEKVTSIEKIKSNVPKEIGQRIMSYRLEGVKVDEDYKRVYPYNELASKVIGFTGSDNQGIIGLESKYESVLKGANGTILTFTDARGREVADLQEQRVEPVPGDDLQLTIDYNIQAYCTQMAEKAYIQKDADHVSILVMNPQNGEMLAMVNYPEFNLNEPFVLTEQFSSFAGTEKENEKLNEMWRNQCVSDTYEPGSTFKIITTAAALEENVVSLNDHFYCPGYIVVEDRRIRCHKTIGHGSESFEEGIENSCNPVFIDVGLRLGASRYYRYFEKFGLLDKTGIDLPGEASTIMHKESNIGPVELATISFGQSFQITPVQLATTVSSLINGGNRVTPHLAKAIVDSETGAVENLRYESLSGICSEDTSKTLRYLLEQVVSDGSGNKAYVKGFEIGGKTATSQTLPRSQHKYISSFLGFAPASNPQVLVLVIIHDPQGIYYGGTVAAPIAREIFENILPYLDK